MPTFGEKHEMPSRYGKVLSLKVLSKSVVINDIRKFVVVFFVVFFIFQKIRHFIGIT